MKRPGDKSPTPPGGRAAERLRQFEEARLPPEERERRRAEEERIARKETGKKRKGDAADQDEPEGAEAEGTVPDEPPSEPRDGGKTELG